jgi:hypothetical protein
MTIPTAPDQSVCPLGVSERTLSALRDGSVSRGEAERLAAHVATCPACGARLAAFDSLADILLSERPPEPDGRLWPAITTAAASPASVRHPRLFSVRPGDSGAATWSRVGALVAVLLLTIGFVALLSLGQPAPPIQQMATATVSSNATATAQSSPIPAGPLTWRPVGFTDPQGVIAFANDGESAYRCWVTGDPQGDSILNIWRTSDRGAHWTPARDIPNEPTVNGCQLVVDTADPSVAALAWQPRGGGAGDSYTGLMTTVDGGATWQEMPSQPFERIDQLDARGGEIYALLETALSDGVEYHLWVSDDRMRSWRRLDRDIPQPVAGFWLQPDGDGILVVASDGAGGGSSQLWSSLDGGFTWRLISVPGGMPSYKPVRFTNAGAAPNGIVARWLQGHFHICVSNATVAMSTPTTSDVTCSSDGGATWQARPLLLVTSGAGPSVAVNLVSLANDGSVLAADGATLYRLPASSSRWQSLGQLSEPMVFYCPSPGAGVLWAVPGYNNSDLVDPQNRVFTADYTP